MLSSPFGMGRPPPVSIDNCSPKDSRPQTPISCRYDINTERPTMDHTTTDGNRAPDFWKYGHRPRHLPDMVVAYEHNSNKDFQPTGCAIGGWGGTISRMLSAPDGSDNFICWWRADAQIEDSYFRRELITCVVNLHNGDTRIAPTFEAERKSGTRQIRNMRSGS